MWYDFGVESAMMVLGTTLSECGIRDGQTRRPTSSPTLTG